MHIIEAIEEASAELTGPVSSGVSSDFKIKVAALGQPFFNLIESKVSFPLIQFTSNWLISHD